MIIRDVNSIPGAGASGEPGGNCPHPHPQRDGAQVSQESKARASSAHRRTASWDRDEDRDPDGNGGRSTFEYYGSADVRNFLFACRSLTQWELQLRHSSGCRHKRVVAFHITGISFLASITSTSRLWICHSRDVGAPTYPPILDRPWVQRYDTFPV